MYKIMTSSSIPQKHSSSSLFDLVVHSAYIYALAAEVRNLIQGEFLWVQVFAKTFQSANSKSVVLSFSPGDPVRLVDWEAVPKSCTHTGPPQNRFLTSVIQYIADKCFLFIWLYVYSNWWVGFCSKSLPLTAEWTSQIIFKGTFQICRLYDPLQVNSNCRETAHSLLIARHKSALNNLDVFIKTDEMFSPLGCLLNTWDFLQEQIHTKSVMVARVSVSIGAFISVYISPPPCGSSHFDRRRIPREEKGTEFVNDIAGPGQPPHTPEMQKSDIISILGQWLGLWPWITLTGSSKSRGWRSNSHLHKAVVSSYIWIFSPCKCSEVAWHDF